MWIPIILASAIAALGYDTARRSYCSCCVRPFAVFTVRGRLGFRRVCRRCWRTHHAWQRSQAR